MHTRHSGMSDLPGFGAFLRESYTEPEALYEHLRGRGMDLVTVTDHDSIDAAESLRGRPGFFLSEEATCRMPSGTTMHLGVYGISERDHIEIQRRRDDLPALLACLRERRLLFSVNHVFSGLTGRRDMADFDWFESAFPAIEARNGMMLACCNREAARLARALRKIMVAGSDAHTVSAAGSAYTEVPGARDVNEFLEGLRNRRGRVRGGSGGFRRQSEAVFETAAAMMDERPWTALLAPLAALVPLAILAHFTRETIFARVWAARLRQDRMPLLPANPRVSEALI